MRRAAGIAVIALSLSGPALAQQPPACGLSTRDWCPAPANDPCGRHKTKAACQADPACHGVRYRGESVIACLFDARGFASNCPTVGCVSAPKK